MSRPPVIPAKAGNQSRNSVLVALDPGLRRDDAFMVSYPQPIPASQTALTLVPPRPSEGALSRGVAKAGWGAVPLRASSQRSTRGGAGLPPGPL